MTPHINAKNGDFASVAIMPGDPLRAKMIAENYLNDVKLVTDVRNMFGFTGYYQNKRISVMGSGMGIPSVSIYAHELFNEYDVDYIIRAGSCGAISASVHVGDVIIGMGACTDSKVNRQRFADHDFAAIADYSLLSCATDCAHKLNIDAKVGNVMTSDSFYNPRPSDFDIIEDMGVLGVEMEAAGLYGLAAQFKKKALTVLTVSDHIRTGESLNAHERQTTFISMIKLVLETAAASQQ